MIFKLILPEQIHVVVPLVQTMEKEPISDAILLQRFREMTEQNYECVGGFLDGQLVAVSGMWFCTRHYSGRSVEIDHVVVEKSYRNQGIGQKLIQWMEQYASSKGCETVELNAYLDNEMSHKFYQRQGYKQLGFHFLKSI
jgi:GNAT superfamily N-acetyltransferase